MTKPIAFPKADFQETIKTSQDGYQVHIRGRNAVTNTGAPAINLGKPVRHYTLLLETPSAEDAARIAAKEPRSIQADGKTVRLSSLDMAADKPIRETIERRVDRRTAEFKDIIDLPAKDIVDAIDQDMRELKYQYNSPERFKKPEAPLMPNGPRKPAAKSQAPIAKPASIDDLALEGLNFADEPAKFNPDEIKFDVTSSAKTRG